MADLLLELGSEELPAGFIDPGVSDLREAVVRGLCESRLVDLTGSAVHEYATPRRLAVIVEAVAPRQPDVDKEVTGPPARVAFDAAGKPTQAAAGFAKVQGVDVDRLTRVSTPKGEYVAVQVREVGKPAVEILPEILTRAIAGLRFPKSMRWGAFEQTYARPLIWILALYGDAVLPLEYAGIRSGHQSRGHRFAAPDPFDVRRPAEYVASLRERQVEVDRSARRQSVIKQVGDAAAFAGCTESRETQFALRNEVTNLVEWPSVLLGEFDPAFLELPREVLLSEMIVHQRTFALDKGGKLTNKFAVIAGTLVRDPVVARHGFERVLRARLSDARFFFDADRKRTLESRVESLSAIVFQHKLGTVLEKVERVTRLADAVAHELKLLDTSRAIIARAARLAKADLVTGMVGEFPELQGIMGGYYATGDGEPLAVAAAIRDQYLPKHVGDSLPVGTEAAVLGIADRLDTLCGIFGIGKPPTGSADPFALRRACLGIILLAWHKSLRFSLRAMLERALELLSGSGKIGEVPRLTLEKLLDFFRARLKALWSEDFPPDVVEAVLASGFDDLWAARKRLEGLGAVVGRGDFLPLATAFKRAVSILEKVPAERLRGEVAPELLREEPERHLWKSQLDVRRRVDARLLEADYQGALEEMAQLKPAIDLFFDKVLVMAEDIPIRENRFRLLLSVRTLFGQVADLSQIQGEQKA